MWTSPNLAGRVRIWCKHKSTDLSSLVSMIQTGRNAVMIWMNFLWDILSAVILTEHLNVTVYLYIVAVHAS